MRQDSDTPRTIFRIEPRWGLTVEQERREEVELVEAECARRVLVSEGVREEMGLWRQLLTEAIDQLAAAIDSEHRNLLLQRRLPASIREPHVIDEWYASVRPLVRAKPNKRQARAREIADIMFFRCQGPLQPREKIRTWDTIRAEINLWEACCRDVSWPQSEVKQRTARLLFRLHEIVRSAEFYNSSDQAMNCAMRLGLEAKHARK